MTEKALTFRPHKSKSKEILIAGPVTENVMKFSPHGSKSNHISASSLKTLMTICISRQALCAKRG